jgi:hypothetical protein
MYVPYAENVMCSVYGAFHGGDVFGYVLGRRADSGGVWVMDIPRSSQKLNPSRLQERMFVYTVTNKVINTFKEVGLPYILHSVEFFRGGSSRAGPGHLRNGSSGSGKKKCVVFKDQVIQSPEKSGAERNREGKEDREFLEHTRHELNRLITHYMVLLHFWMLVRHRARQAPFLASP